MIWSLVLWKYTDQILWSNTKYTLIPCVSSCQFSPKRWTVSIKFLRSVQANVASVMCSYSWVHAVPDVKTEFLSTLASRSKWVTLTVTLAMNHKILTPPQSMGALPVKTTRRWMVYWKQSSGSQAVSSAISADLCCYFGLLIQSSDVMSGTSSSYKRS